MLWSNYLDEYHKNLKINKHPLKSGSELQALESELDC